MKNIEILYEDDLCLIVNKPAGLAVQGGEKVKSSLDKILAEFCKPVLSGGNLNGSENSPFLVHRLDKDTSGIILTAKTREAAALFSGLLGTFNGSFKGGNSSSPASTSLFSSARKQYIAVCSGYPVKNEGTIKLDLQIKNSVKKSETRYRVMKNGRLILPNFELETFEFSVLEMELGTGRMHQIRRHLAMNGNPVLGDDKYGDFTLNKKLHKTIGLKRLLLHASRLIIGEHNLDICAPLPGYFSAFHHQ